VELRGDDRLVVVQVAPRDADDPVALDLEVAIPRAVGLEGARDEVRLATVELDHEALFLPQRVDRVRADLFVDSRPRKRVGVEESGLVSRRYSVSWTARSSCWRLVRTSARSSSVRAGVVTGIPRCSVISSGASTMW
jgi:hypothetical protein